MLKGIIRSVYRALPFKRFALELLRSTVVVSVLPRRFLLFLSFFRLLRHLHISTVPNFLKVRPLGLLLLNNGHLRKALPLHAEVAFPKLAYAQNCVERPGCSRVVPLAQHLLFIFDYSAPTTADVYVQF